MSKRVKCYEKDGQVRKYYGKNIFAVFAENDNQVEDARYDCQEHIMENGPTLGAYFVLSNMIDARSYTQTSNIYLENFPYDTHDGKPSSLNKDTSIKTKFEIVGGHAVAVIGWGETNVNAINPDTRKPYGLVKYWIVRNSWGTEWHNGGYFNMAMYPHNKFSQFDMGIQTGEDRQGKPIWMGGMSLIEYDRDVLVPVDSAIKFMTDKYDTLPITLPIRHTTEEATPNGGKAPNGGVVPDKAPNGGVVPDKAPNGSVVPDKAPNGGVVPVKAPNGGTVQTSTGNRITWGEIVWIILIVIAFVIFCVVIIYPFLSRSNKKTKPKTGP